MQSICTFDLLIIIFISCLLAILLQAIKPQTDCVFLGFVAAQDQSVISRPSRYNNAVVIVICKGIPSESDANRTGFEGLFFYHSRLLQVLKSHYNCYVMLNMC